MWAASREPTRVVEHIGREMMPPTRTPTMVRQSSSRQVQQRSVGTVKIDRLYTRLLLFAFQHPNPGRKFRLVMLKSVHIGMDVPNLPPQGTHIASLNVEHSYEAIHTAVEIGYAGLNVPQNV
jgi:hypothetical protein